MATLPVPGSSQEDRWEHLQREAECPVGTHGMYQWHVPAQGPNVCIRCMYLQHVSVACTSHMYWPHVPVTCTGHMYQSHVPATCTSHMYQSHVPVTCTGHVYQPRVSAMCTGHITALMAGLSTMHKRLNTIEISTSLCVLFLELCGVC